jgi:hypothetical protein
MSGTAIADAWFESGQSSAKEINKMSTPDDHKSATQLVMAYLEAHPQACDTIEGIARWWLMSQQINDATFAVKRALEELKKRGYVREERKADGRIFYCVQENELSASTSGFIEPEQRETNPFPAIGESDFHEQ